MLLVDVHRSIWVVFVVHGDEAVIVTVSGVLHELLTVVDKRRQASYDGECAQSGAGSMLRLRTDPEHSMVPVLPTQPGTLFRCGVVWVSVSSSRSTVRRWRPTKSAEYASTAKNPLWADSSSLASVTVRLQSNVSGSSSAVTELLTGSIRYVHVVCLNRWRHASTSRSAFFQVNPISTLLACADPTVYSAHNAVTSTTLRVLVSLEWPHLPSLSRSSLSISSSYSCSLLALSALSSSATLTTWSPVMTPTPTGFITP